MNLGDIKSCRSSEGGRHWLHLAIDILLNLLQQILTGQYLYLLILSHRDLLVPILHKSRLLRALLQLHGLEDSLYLIRVSLQLLSHLLYLLIIHVHLAGFHRLELSSCTSGLLRLCGYYGLACELLVPLSVRYIYHQLLKLGFYLEFHLISLLIVLLSYPSLFLCDNLLE